MNLTNIRYLVSPVVLDDGCLEAVYSRWGVFTHGLALSWLHEDPKSSKSWRNNSDALVAGPIPAGEYTTLPVALHTPIVGMTPEWLREDASVRSASAYRVGREVMLGGYTFSRWALDMQYVLLLGCVP